MQHTGLVLSLEKSALQAVRADLMARQAKSIAIAKFGATSEKVTKHSIRKFTDNKTDKTNIDNNDGIDEVQMLSEVNFVDFSVALLQNMNCLPFEKKSEYQNYTSSTGFFLQLASIVSVFEAVDVDSRGIIDFQDFTNFCLRLARLLFKPDVKRSLSNYLQNHDQNVSSFPSYRMRFISYCQSLVVFDSDTPRVRVYG